MSTAYELWKETGPLIEKELEREDGHDAAGDAA